MDLVKQEERKFNLTFLLQWLLANAVNKGVEAMALLKFVWGLRYHESSQCDVSIQLEKIKSIRMQTVVKKGEGNLISPSFRGGCLWML